MYFDGNGTGVSTWYGVGNNPFAAIDCTDGVMDFWVNPSNSSWYNILIQIQMVLHKLMVLE